MPQMDKPKFSVSAITTFHQAYDEDLANYAEAGVEGIGIWEFKMPAGEDAETLAKLKDSGPKATTMIPATRARYPVPFPGQPEPPERPPAVRTASTALRAAAPAGSSRSGATVSRGAPERRRKVRVRRSRTSSPTRSAPSQTASVAATAREPPRGGPRPRSDPDMDG